MAGNVNIPASEWGRQRLDLPPGGPWPPILVELDLRYWEDPKACERRPRPDPTTLARTWGWSRSRVRRLLAKRDGKPDPTFVPKKGKRPTTTDHEPTTTDHEPTTATSGKPPEVEPTDHDRPRTDHDRPRTDRDLIDTRAKTSPSPSPSPSRKAKAVRDPSADWTAAALFWSSEVNPALGRRPAMPSATSKLGVRLAGEIKRNGLDAVLDAFRWLAYGQTWHARSQRARKTVDMWTPLRHVEKWGAYWRDIGDTPDDPADNGKPKEQTFAQRLAAMEQN